MSTQIKSDHIYTYTEAAALLDKTVSTIKKWALNGKITARDGRMMGQTIIDYLGGSGRHEVKARLEAAPPTELVVDAKNELLKMLRFQL